MLTRQPRQLREDAAIFNAIAKPMFKDQDLGASSTGNKFLELDLMSKRRVIKTWGASEFNDKMVKDLYRQMDTLAMFNHHGRSPLVF